MLVQLEQREGEVRQLRGERRTVDEAVEELRTMLMQSVAERTRLAGVFSHGHAHHQYSPWIQS